MTTHNQNLEAKSVREQGKAFVDKVSLDFDARHEVELVKEYNPNYSQEEVLFEVAKSFVKAQSRSKRQERYLNHILGGATLISIILGINAFSSHDWLRFFYAAALCVVSLGIVIRLHKS